PAPRPRYGSVRPAAPLAEPGEERDRQELGEILAPPRRIAQRDRGLPAEERPAPAQAEQLVALLVLQRSVAEPVPAPDERRPCRGLQSRALEPAVLDPGERAALGLAQLDVAGPAAGQR